MTVCSDSLYREAQQSRLFQDSIPNIFRCDAISELMPDFLALDTPVSIFIDSHCTYRRMLQKLKSAQHEVSKKFIARFLSSRYVEAVRRDLKPKPVHIEDSHVWVNNLHIGRFRLQ